MLYYPGFTPIGAFLFESPNIVDKINRSYMKVQDLFAKIGGLINALVIIFRILSTHYFRFPYINKLIDLSNEEQINRKSIKLNEYQDSMNLMKPKNKLKINNYIGQDKKETPKKEVKIQNNEIKLNKIITKEISNEFKDYKVSYLKYVRALVFCKSNSLENIKQMNKMTSKIDLIMKIRIVNFFYYKHHEKYSD